MNEIVQRGDKVLRKVAKEVPIEEIGGRKISTIIKRMRKALEGQEDGVALAAPQIGENLRIFVVSHRLFEMMEEEKRARQSKRQNLEEFEEGKTDFEDMVFINPEIIKASKEKKIMEEGCLSERWLYGKVRRAQKTLVKAYDEKGKSFTMGGAGLLSQAFQHETDHLDGVLFTDKATDVKDLPPSHNS